MKLRLFGASLVLVFASALRAELKLPAIVGDNMVLQQQLANPVWGWDRPGTRVTVAFAGQSHTATAGADGRWTVKLAPVPANATPQTLKIAGTTTRELKNVLVGEVWMCSGQSNMGWTMNASTHGDIEALASRHPNLRLITVPRVGTQQKQTDFKGQWEAATPETVRSFSAVGFLFGRYIHEIVGVPVGLINNAWGGSAAEAWVERGALAGDARFALLMENTTKREADLTSEKGRAAFEAQMKKWQEDSAAAKKAKKAAPRQPTDYLAGNARPGNIWNGMVYPTLGYGIKGVIWYQGESNAGRAHEYRDLFPFMIERWRAAQGQGDFPFYWVQLADFRAEKAEPAESDWAELREAQTRTLALPNTGQAVIIDIGEGRDIHPRNKYDVAARLVRWALAKDYGIKVPYRSPEFKSLAIEGNKAVVTLEMFGSTLRPFDVTEPRGFAVCGEDKVWHWATGRVVGGNKVEISSERVPAPVAVRYAWADNPVCNLYSNDNLPVTPFRTDDFEMITKPKPVAAAAKKN